MAEMDKSLGMTGNADVVRKMRGNQLNEQNKARQNRQAALSAPTSNTLNDSDLASNLQQQAQKMITEAKGLLAEADRLQKQASDMIPPPVVTATKPVKAKKKTKASA
jgi:hypothetical protein